jgi:transposase
MDEETYQEIEALLPKQHGNVKLSNRHVLEALMYICRNGCTWRGLPKEYGRWHTIYMRLSRWAAHGVLTAIYEKLLQKRLIARKITLAALDSTSCKVHQDAMGGGEKKHRQVEGRMEHQDTRSGSQPPPADYDEPFGGEQERRAGREEAS